MTGALESGEHQQIVTSVGSFQLLPTDGGHYLLLVLTEYLFCVVTFYSLFTDQIKISISNLKLILGVFFKIS